MLMGMKFRHVESLLRKMRLTLKLMRNSVIAIGLVVAFFYSKSKAQTVNEQIGYLLTDALFYSDQYITPATDAAVYQASLLG